MEHVGGRTQEGRVYQKIIERLQNGESVILKPSGHSMAPRIKSRQEITIIPIDRIEVGDVVLAKVSGRFYIHLITAIDKDRVQIGNNHGHINGWTSHSKIFGRAINV